MFWIKVQNCWYHDYSPDDHDRSTAVAVNAPQISIPEGSVCKKQNIIHIYFYPKAFYNTIARIYLYDLVYFWYKNTNVGLSCIVYRFSDSKMEDFDNIRFMATQCQYLFSKDFHRTKLLLKRGISLEKLEEKIPKFHARLTPTRWMSFTLEPYYANE